MGNIKNFEFKQLTPSEVIQGLIFIGILITCIFTFCSIKQQSKFNRNSLRPWLNIKPRQEIGIEDGIVKISYFINCTGRSPAFQVEAYSILTENDTFPVSKIKEEMKREQAKSFLVPGGQTYVDKKSIRIKYIITKTNAITNEVRKDTIAVTSSDIIDRINGGNAFVHFYLDYEDYSANQYFLRLTTQLTDYNRLLDIVDWKIIGASEEKIR